MNLELENNKLKEAYQKAILDMPKETIGVMQEHTLHRVLKFYYTMDVKNHEIQIGKMYADVILNEKIIEIQTKAFNALRKKLDIFLKDYHVTIIYPMALNKTIYLNSQYGELLSCKKSPKHARPLEIMWELYKIKNYLLNDKLHFKILMLDIDEYRLEQPKKWVREKGYIRENQIPKYIHEIYEINKPTDFKDILKLYDLPQSFTSKVFAKKCHLTIKKAGVALNVLTYLNVVKRIGKEKNSYLYEIV